MLPLPLPAHEDDATKLDRGTVVVVGGSPQTPGAVILAGLAALRVGAGRLRIATHPDVAVPIAVEVPEARVATFADIHALADGADCVLVGPGVIDDDPTRLLDAVVTARPACVVVDAGVLPALPGRCPPPLPVIAIPNESEADALGPDPAARLGITVSVRGPRTVVTTPDGRCWTDDHGTVGLATSGSGDVAAGIVAGLAARGATPEAAACWGARLHGQAGERLGGIGFLARDLLDVLPALLP